MTSADSPVLLSAAAIVGGFLGYVGVVVAARRNQRQPVEQEPAAELEVVALLLAHPEEWLRVEADLHVEDFTVPAAKVAYGALDTAARHSALADLRYRGHDVDELNAAIATARHDVALLSALTAETAAAADALADDPRWPADGHRTVSAPEALQARILGTGQDVLSARAGRDQNTERSPFLADPVTGTLTRGATVADRGRMMVATLLAALAAVVGTGAMHVAFTVTAAEALGVLALLALVFVSVEFAVVDLDTFYLDQQVFVAVGALSWLLALAAALVQHNPGRLIAGGVVAVGIALAFEGLSRLSTMLRGHAQGAGDTWIVLATAGVPAALTGSWQVGLYGMLAGCLFTIGFWLIQRVRGLITADTPVAFGPYLAAGWVAGLAWWMLAVAH